MQKPATTQKPVALRQKASSSTKTAANAIDTSRNQLNEQMAAFLKSGGKVNQIPQGVSGYVNLAGPKHIVINNKKASETK